MSEIIKTRGIVASATNGKITQDLLRELFDYRDGNLYWKVRKGNRKSGDLAGSVMKSGYRQVMINGKMYYAHRLIFLHHYESIPEFLDHIDGDRSNNNINNLRGVTRQQNGWNAKKFKSMGGEPTSSIFKGVSREKHYEKWRAGIRIDGKQKHLGMFASEIEAAEASDTALIERDGKFARTNKSMRLL